MPEFAKYYDGPPKLTAPFYVISDTHFYHDNIVKYSGRDKQIERMIGPDRARRIDHNEFMVQKWNSVVTDSDKILHLGDLYVWFKGGREKFEANILPRLKGDKYLIIGNHDRDEPSEYERMGFTVVRPFSAKINGRKVSFDHYPWAYNEEHPGEINGYPIAADWKEGSVPSRHGQINVSVEMIGYTPILITDLLS